MNDSGPFGGSRPTQYQPLDRMVHSRVPSGSAKVVRVASEISTAVTEQFLTSMRARNAEPLTGWLAVLAALLYRYSAQPTFAIATTLPGLDAGRAFGLNLDFSKNPSFNGTLLRLGGALATLREGPALPAAALKELEVLFLGGAEPGQGVTDLGLCICAPAGRLGSLEFRGRTDWIDEATLRAFARHFGALVGEVVVRPESPLVDLLLEPRSEPPTFAGSHASVAASQRLPQGSLAECFQLQAKLTPGRVAIQGTTAFTFEQLDRLSDALSLHIGKGVPAGSPVALLMNHDAWVPVGMLGALKARRPYVPLAPAYPDRRLEFILSDSGARGVVVDAANEARVRQLVKDSVPVIRVDATGEVGAAPDVGDAAALAYLLYTSGSTGEPKAVMQTPQNVLHLIRAYVENLGLRPEDRLSLLSSYSFDAAVMDIYSALLSGATLFPIDLRQTGADRLPELLRGKGITVYHSTPTVYRHLLQALGPEGRLPNIRLVVLGGEEVLPSDVDGFRAHFSPEAVFVNGFGPTECTIAMQYFCHGQALGERSRVPVGRPVRETEVALLDDDGFPSAAGEIRISSNYVAQGYWRRAELTQKAFGVAGGKRFYLTGDLGRLRPDGAIEFLGRRDLQVKVHGFRIELGEVEAALLEHPSVVEAAAVARADAGEAQRLVAYVKGRSGNAPSVADLRSFLRERLPDHMIPSAVMALDAFPLTDSGKIDRGALPAPGAPASDSGRLADEVERALAAIWGEVLGREGIQPTDDFFALGGYSLNAFGVVSRIRERLGIEVAVSAVFDYPVLAELAAHLRAEGVAVGAVSSPSVPSQASRAGARNPLSFTQQRIWAMGQGPAGMNAWANLGRCLKLEGELRVPLLTSAFRTIVQRHAILRTAFIDDGDGPGQEVRPDADLQVVVEDLASVPEADRIAVARARYHALSSAAFALAKPPLARVTLLAFGPSSHFLLIAFPHIAFDGGSFGVLLGELSELYAAACEGRPPRLPELSTQFADFARDEQRAASEDVRRREARFWRARLAGTPARLEFREDLGLVRVGAPLMSHWDLSPEMETRLDHFCREHRVTFHMTMLGALRLFLEQLTGSREHSVGLTISKRQRAELGPLIGCFVSRLAVAGNIPAAATFLDVVHATTDALAAAYAQSVFPLWHFLADIWPEVRADQPMEQVLYMGQEGDEVATELQGLRVTTVTFPEAGEAGTATTTATPALEVDHRKGATRCTFHQFPASTRFDLPTWFAQELEGLIARPNAPLSSELRRFGGSDH